MTNNSNYNRLPFLIQHFGLLGYDKFLTKQKIVKARLEASSFDEELLLEMAAKINNSLRGSSEVTNCMSKCSVKINTQN